MKLDRQTVAKIAALAFGWPTTEFAKCAENKLLYWFPTETFFVIGRGDKIFPLDKLTDSNRAKHLTLFLPYDAVSVRILTILWLIEVARKTNNRESYCHILIVGDVGRDAFTGEVRYGVIRFGDTSQLLTWVGVQVSKEKVRHLKKMQEKYSWMNAPAGVLRLCNAYIRNALKKMLIDSPAVTTTLRKADEHPSG